MSRQISFMERERERGSPLSILVTFTLGYTTAFALLFGNVTEILCSTRDYCKGSTYLIQAMLIFFYTALKQLIQNPTNKKNQIISQEENQLLPDVHKLMTVGFYFHFLAKWHL